MNDKKLLKFVTDFTKGVIGESSSKGKCYIVSAPLYSYLLSCGIETKLVEGEVDTKLIGDISPEDGVWIHFWLVLPDGRIIDPTADQFNSRTTETNMPRIYIGKKPDWYKQRCEKNVG